MKLNVPMVLRQGLNLNRINANGFNVQTRQALDLLNGLNSYQNYDGTYGQNYHSAYAQPQPQQNGYDGTYGQNYTHTQRPKATGVLLKKGQKQSLSTLSPNLNRLRVGLGWDAIGGYDLDAEVFMLGSNEKVLGDSWFVFYGQTTSPDGAIVHHGDNTNGSATGDDEIIDIQLDRLNPNVKKLVFVVTINEAKQYGYNFSNVSNAYIRVLDQASNRELIRFNLSEYYANVTSMVVGEVYLYRGEWKFNPVGDGTADDLYGLCYRYGVNVAD